MISTWVIPFLCLFVQFSLGEPKELQCKLPRSKICLIEALLWNGNQTPKLPDLSSKHTLIINSGIISNFSENIARQLGNVNKLKLGQLGIRTIYISPIWISLKAESNQIYELVVADLPRPEDEEDPKKEDTPYVDAAVEFNTLLPIADEPYPRPVNNLRFLNLINNKLKFIGELKHLYKLEEILLDGNQIEYMEMGTFSDMKMLKHISLTKNKISRISTDKPVNFPSLEHLSFAFNELTKLEVKKWTAPQLATLNLTHNHLVRMDVPNFDHFESLERLGMAKNSWHCDWLDTAAKHSKRNYVHLGYSSEPCSEKQFKVDGLCCSYTHQVEDEPVSALDRINRIKVTHSTLKTDLTDKVNSFHRKWKEEWDILNLQAREKLKPYEELESRIQRDDKEKAKMAGRKLEGLIEECQYLIGKLKLVINKNKEYNQKFTNLFYTNLAEKNKLLQVMSTAAKLDEEMKNYGLTFNENN